MRRVPKTRRNTISRLRAYFFVVLLTTTAAKLKRIKEKIYIINLEKRRVMDVNGDELL